ncbi:MAG TPA: hypothetical protein VFU81_15380 [Thermomicrobiales bacterium]|nr:hypothetical protein [Thermomicrobiales bacterium]
MADQLDKKSPAGREAYRLLEELDRCEALLEDMDELGLSSREEIERHMEALHQRLDELEAS